MSERVTIRLVCHDVPMQWHSCTPGFVKRLEQYLLRSPADIWVQYHDGRKSITRR